MPRNDKLYEESRIIRRAVNEGKTTSEIMQMLSLTSTQIKYRVETRYTEKIANKIMKLLEANDKGKRKRDKEEVENQQVEKTNGRQLHTATEFNNAIVVDTCALKCIGSFEFIMSYETVILLVDIVKQLDNHKGDEGIFGKNIRSLLRASAEDQEETKIKIRNAGETSDSTDSKLLAFCKGKNVVLYTADNGLATIARYFDIKYILAKDLDENRAVDVTKSLDERPLKRGIEEELSTKSNEANSLKQCCEDKKVDVTPIALEQADITELKRQMQENSITKNQTKSTISNVAILGKFLTLTIPETYKINYHVISGNEVKCPLGSNIINLKIGDIIVVSTYKQDKKFLNINRYEITDIADKEHAIYLGTDRVKDNTQIERLDLPREVKIGLKSYFSLVIN